MKKPERLGVKPRSRLRKHSGVLSGACAGERNL